MSIKRLSQISFIMVAIVVSLSIFINFTLVATIQDFTDKNKEIETTFSIQLAKIQSVVETLELLTNENNDFSTNTDQLSRDLSSLIVSSQQSITMLNELFKEMDDYSLKRHSSYLDNMYPLLENISINLVVLSRLNYVDQIDEVANVYGEIETDALELNALNKNLLSLISRDMSFLINGVIIFLILFIGLFAYTIKGFVSKQLPFIQKNLIALGSHHYVKQDSKIKPFFLEEKIIHKEIDSLIDENSFIEDIRKSLQNVYLMEEAMDLIFKKIRERIAVDRIGIAFVDYKKEKFVAEYGVMVESDLILGPGFEVPIESSSLMDMLAHKQRIVVDDLSEMHQSKPDSAALKLITEEGILSNVTFPLITNNTVFGLLFLSSKSKNFFSDEYLTFLERIIFEINSLLNRAYFSKIVFSKMTESFAQLVESKDNETGDHIDRMVKYSTLLAKELKKQPLRKGYEIDDKIILEIERQASSHDIGKVGIPDAVLKKNGPLNDNEWKIMKSHPQIGAQIFQDLREGLKIFDKAFYQVAQDITMYHHEHWDGSGYPKGLKGLDIPLVARIVAIADVFDAISSKRVYKEAFDLEQTFSIIEQSKGSHLDPYLVDLFLQAKENVIEIYNNAYNTQSF